MFYFLKNTQKELTFLIFSILISGITLNLSYSYFISAQASWEKTSLTLSDLKRQYFNTHQKIRIFDDFSDRFNKLKTDGIIPNNQAFNWNDIIKRIVVTHKIPSIKIKINPHKTLNSIELKDDFPGLQVFTSSINLQMILLHEADLLTALNSLHNMTTELFEVDNCMITRISGQPKDLTKSNSDKNFTAICNLTWYSLQPNLSHLKNQKSPL